MTGVLNRSLFFIRERIGLLKAAINYDILDPASSQVIMECREENLGRFTKLFRFSSCKRTTPFDIRVRTVDGEPVLRVRRGVPIYVSRVEVRDHNDDIIGGFKQKLFSISGAFDVLDAQGKCVCRLKAGLTGCDFRFLAPDDMELARVTKKWAGLGKELFTSADDYMLQIDDAVPQNSTIRQLTLASALCIGMVTKMELP